MSKKFFSSATKNFWISVIILIFVSAGYYVSQRNNTSAVLAPSFYVVEAAERGVVSSGIQTTGEIVAAQKLNLDVYKQTSRIEAVNVVNGGHVEADEVLLSFDKSDAFVDVEAAQVRVAEAKLALSEQQINYNDPNTTIRTLENDIKELATATTQAELDKKKAYRDYLNADLEAESGNKQTEDKIAPLVSGLYTSVTEGEYRISLYSSGANSGYSYRVSGLPGTTESVIWNIETPLGYDGLKIKFTTNNDLQTGDEWLIAVPNTHSPDYVKNKEAYEETINNLEESITGYKLSIENKQQQIEDLRLTDSTAYRDLSIAQAKTSLSEAQVQLAQNYDVVREQNIVAPFSGTVEGMENVVVGASPTRDTNDPISLGTLISDDFLATFSLGAVDVAKVSVGQKVLVTITSFPNLPPLEASITEISSLPNSDGVAQYEVQALIKIPKDSDLDLREGLLADIEVVQKEVTDVVRIPSSAITYERGKATVDVVDTLNETQQQMFDRLGIVRSETGEIPSYPVEVTAGLVGTFYTEINEGLEEGTLVIISQEESSATGAVQQQSFGPGGGTRRDSSEQPPQ